MKDPDVDICTLLDIDQLSKSWLAFRVIVKIPVYRNKPWWHLTRKKNYSYFNQSQGIAYLTNDDYDYYMTFHPAEDPDAPAS